jgi:hypothetical protein
MTDRKLRAVRPHANKARSQELDFAPVLAAEFGNQPGILLDAKGSIVAVNSSAADLLGRPAEALAGTPFGIWAPQDDSTDLDIVRAPGSGLAGAVIRAKKVGVPGESGLVPVLLRELPAPGQTPLPEAVELALFDASSDITGGLDYSVGPLPTVRVGPQARQSLARLIQSLVALAGLAHPRLSISLLARGAEWVELRIAIQLAGSEGRLEPPLEDLPICFEEATRCTLTFENPEFVGTVRLPCETVN